jgi:hypothetical protein
MGVEFEIAWREFLHEFMLYRQPGFFAIPPDKFTPEYKAQLAGAAEFLSEEFGLRVPIWVYDPQYTLLPELWEPDGWMFPQDPESVERRKAKAHPAFLKRNVLFESRNHPLGGSSRCEAGASFLLGMRHPGNS